MKRIFWSYNNRKKTNFYLTPDFLFARADQEEPTAGLDRPRGHQGAMDRGWTGQDLSRGCIIVRGPSRTVIEVV
jgi:hypothetical protein